MLVTAILLAASAPTAVARDIDLFCKSEPACVARQRQSLRYFLNLSVVFDAPRPKVERCMLEGKVGRAVDWAKAEACLRRWSKGRRAILPGAPR